MTLDASPTPAVTRGGHPHRLARDCQGTEIAQRADEAPSLPCCIRPYEELLLLGAQRARRSWFHAFLYYSAPDIAQEWTWITPGSACAVLGWLLASLGFAFCISNFGSCNVMYSGIGAVIVLLTC